VTRPLVGWSSPAIIRIVVDFPEPFGPRNPVTIPGCTTKFNPSTASLVPYRLLRFSTSIMVFAFQALVGEMSRRRCSMQMAGGHQAGGFRTEVKASVTDRCGSAGGRENVYAAGTAFLPWTTIGIRASAVVMMVELRERVVLTAVAGHRLPHCWRDGCEQERDCSI
jgi:hypothetical protein